MDLKYQQTEGQDPIDGYTSMYGPYKGVLLVHAKMILGDKLFNRMMADKIRCKGPTVDTVYPWNVAAYRTIGQQEVDRSGAAEEE